MDLAAYTELAVRLVNTDPGERAGPDALTDRAGLRTLLADHEGWRARATDGDLARLRALRGQLRPVLEAVARGADAEADARLNALLARSVIRPRISGRDARQRRLALSEPAADVATAYAAAAVMGLAVLLTGTGADRLGVCAAAPCRRIFLDTSTNRSRRYCSERCSTRANVAAHRARHRVG